MELRKYTTVRILVWLAYPTAICILLALMFLTCGGKTAKTENEAPPEDSIPSKKEFRLSEQRAEYLVTHYRDHFVFYAGKRAKKDANKTTKS